MADTFEPEEEPSALLLCDETKDLCFGGDVDHHENAGCGPIHDDGDQNQSRSWLSAAGSEPLIHLPEMSEEGFAYLVGRERDYLPKQDYLCRLRCGHLDLPARTQAFDWMCKAHSYYGFGPLSLCAAVNYMDRFLSICDLPRDKAWAVQLLALACLSIAAKVEETCVPPSIELQVGDPEFMFGGKTIQRMELLVLDTLEWKMNAVTPCSFLDYFLNKWSDSHNKNSLSSTTTTSSKVVNRSMQLILCTLRGIDFLEFKPSEIAAAVAIFVSAEFQAIDIDNPISCFLHMEKERVLKCREMIKGMASGNINKRKRSTGQGVERSPVGVLDVPCFSFRSDQLATTRVGSCPNICSQIATTTTTTAVSSSSSPETKRRKL